MIHIKSPREIELMRKTCRLAADTLDYLGQQLKIGMSTEEVNQLAHQYITERDAYPSPLNYHGFPKSVCTSRNDVICHGIPNADESLQDGDIFNIDVTTYLQKFHGDTNRTFFIGNVSAKDQKFVDVTYQCMMAAIKIVKPDVRLGDIGATIQEMAEEHGYSVVREYCGHGIGREFHEDPQVLHYGIRGKGVKLKKGMTFTIEPMINQGKRDCKLLKDGWTVKTKDGSRSAQFEHTILVTDNGAEVLTTAPYERIQGNNLTFEH